MSLHRLPDLIGKNGIFNDGDWVESKDQDPNGDVRLIQLADIGDGEYLDKSNRFLTSLKAAELRCTYLEPGDILVARMPDPLGRACIFPGDSKPCVTVVDVCIVRPDTEVVYPKWLLHKINSPEFRSLMNTFATGTTRKRISRKNLGKLEFRLPPLAEQRRIAAILDKADALRAKRRAALAKLDTLLQSTFLTMFGDPVTNPMGWEVVEFSQAPIQIIDGDRGKNYPKRDELLESGYCLFLNTKNVLSRGFSFENYQFVSKEKDAILRKGKLNRHDVVLTTRGTVGNAAYYGENIPFEHIRINSGMVILRTIDDHLLPQYLEFYISTNGFKRQVERLRSGTAQPQLPIKTLNMIKIPLPPIGKQRMFIKYRKYIEGIQASYWLSLRKLEYLFHSLQQRAFKGQL